MPKNVGTWLDDEEQDYIQHNFKSFSEYVHNSIKRDLSLSKKNKRLTWVQKTAQSVIMLAIGALFMFFTPTQKSLLSMGMVFGLGIFFIGYGVLSFYHDWQEWKNNG